MAPELKITWDGTAPGLAAHRLSVGAFGEPLRLLLWALQRVATQIVSNAVADGEKSPVGRIANVAKNIDIEIESIKQNSSGVNALVTFREPPVPQQVELFGNLVEKATMELLDGIERESKGQPTLAVARRYLYSLPQGTTKQRYEFVNGGAPKIVEIGEVKHAEIPLDLPYLISLEGSVTGVGFEPAKNEVRIRTEEISSINISASAEDVAKALDVRKDKIRAMAVHVGNKARLIALRRASEPVFKFDADAAKKHIFERWDNVLKALSK